MLVLSRKPGETIIVGDDIVVTVVSINGNRIKLGIECRPKSPSSVGSCCSSPRASAAKSQRSRANSNWSSRAPSKWLVAFDQNSAGRGH